MEAVVAVLGPRVVGIGLSGRGNSDVLAYIGSQRSLMGVDVVLAEWGSCSNFAQGIVVVEEASTK